MKKLLIILMMGMMLLTLVSAEVNPCGNQNEFLGTLEQNTTITLTATCDDCSYVNVTAMKYPNGTTDFFNLATTRSNRDFYRTFSSTQETGCYTYTLLGDKGGVQITAYKDFLITYNGNPSPDGFLTAIFIIGFLVIVFFLGYFFISNLGHFAQFDYDLDDLIKNVSMYLVLVAFYFLHATYLGYPLINTILLWTMGIGAFTHIGMSFLAFIMSHLKKVANFENAVRENGQ